MFLAPSPTPHSNTVHLFDTETLQWASQPLPPRAAPLVLVIKARAVQRVFVAHAYQAGLSLLVLYDAAQDDMPTAVCIEFSDVLVQQRDGMPPRR